MLEIFCIICDKKLKYFFSVGKLFNSLQIFFNLQSGLVLDVNVFFLIDPKRAIPKK